MRKSSLIVAAIVLLSLLFVGLRLLPGARATTLYVGGVGPDNYTTIQDALTAANPGDTIFVYNGSYFEDLIINKPVSLVGESVNTTTITHGIGDMIQIWSDWVNISGFSLIRSGLGVDSVIELDQVSNCTVTGNYIAETGNGIHLYKSTENTIKGNRLTQSMDSGIFLEYSDGNIVEDNIAFSNTRNGILLSGSDHNVLSGNSFWDNPTGIRLLFSDNNTIVGSNGSASWDAISIVNSWTF